MAIAMRARPVDTEAFIGGAPDTKPARWQCDNKTHLAVTVASTLVEKLDAISERQPACHSARRAPAASMIDIVTMYHERRRHG
jgi:hypothetical protein